MKNETRNELREFGNYFSERTDVTLQEVRSFNSDINYILRGNNPSDFLFFWGFIQKTQNELYEIRTKIQELEERKSKKGLKELYRKEEILTYINQSYKDSFRYEVPTVRNFPTVIAEFLKIQKSFISDVELLQVINSITTEFQSYAEGFTTITEGEVKDCIRCFIDDLGYDNNWNFNQNNVYCSIRCELERMFTYILRHKV